MLGVKFFGLSAAVILIVTFQNCGKGFKKIESSMDMSSEVTEASEPMIEYVYNANAKVISAPEPTVTYKVGDQLSERVILHFDDTAPSETTTSAKKYCWRKEKSTDQCLSEDLNLLLPHLDVADSGRYILFSVEGSSPLVISLFDLKVNPNAPGDLFSVKPDSLKPDVILDFDSPSEQVVVAKLNLPFRSGVKIQWTLNGVDIPGEIYRSLRLKSSKQVVDQVRAVITIAGKTHASPYFKIPFLKNDAIACAATEIEFNGACRFKICTTQKRTIISNGAIVEECINLGSAYSAPVYQCTPGGSVYLPASNSCGCKAGEILYGGQCKAVVCTQNLEEPIQNGKRTTACLNQGTLLDSVNVQTTCDTNFVLVAGACKARICSTNKTTQITNGTKSEACLNSGTEYGTPTYQCSLTGSVYLDASQGCGCGIGTVLYAGQCKARVCSENQEVPIPNGKQLTNCLNEGTFLDTARATITCNPTYALSTAKSCVCASNMHEEGGRCVLTCAAGQKRIDGVCKWNIGLQLTSESGTVVEWLYKYSTGQVSNLVTYPCSNMKTWTLADQVLNYCDRGFPSSTVTNNFKVTDDPNSDRNYDSIDKAYYIGHPRYVINIDDCKTELSPKMEKKVCASKRYQFREMAWPDLGLVCTSAKVETIPNGKKTYACINNGTALATTPTISCSPSYDYWPVGETCVSRDSCLADRTICLNLDNAATTSTCNLSGCSTIPGFSGRAGLYVCSGGGAQVGVGSESWTTCPTKIYFKQTPVNGKNYSYY